MMSTKNLPALLALALCFAIPPALAEHEADHRYVVEGYVLNSEEQPRPNVKVVLSAAGDVLGSDETDSRGFYKIRAHLHNEDLGKKLTVKAGSQVSEIDVTFDPSDRTTERVHRLNFIGEVTTESSLGFRGLPNWLYAVIAAVVILVVVRIGQKQYKKRKKKNAMAKKKKAKKNKPKKRRAR